VTSTMDGVFDREGLPVQKTIRPRVKICCMGSIEEARIAVQAGVSAVGLVSAMPSGPGVIDEESIAAIARTIPPGVASFLLTSLQDPDAIIAQQRRLGASVLQLVDVMDPDSYDRLRTTLPGIGIVQVIHVMGPQSVDEARRIASQVDALLLDSGNPSATVKELGGTGRVHNWEISRAIREEVAVPVYLAGGLHAANVAEAVRTVEPFGVDVCSGVRTDGALDEEKLAAFMEEVAGYQ
jgi:phosphoribosylanthranilate isomerase